MDIWDEPEWTDATSLRQAFNQGQFYERALRGELRARFFNYDNHLSRRQRQKIQEPKCTRSQMVAYYETDGSLVALIHQYRRRDGTLKNGRPDPKRLVYEGRVLALSQALSS